jgi:hypothetical protein
VRLSSLDRSTGQDKGVAFSWESNRLRLTKNVTGFPAGINAAATFSRRLMRARGTAIAEEFRGKGIKFVPFLACGPALCGVTDALLRSRLLAASTAASSSGQQWILCVTPRQVVHGRGKPDSLLPCCSPPIYSKSDGFLSKRHNVFPVIP